MRRLLLAAAVLAALLPGGCGIPDGSDVRVIGPGPSSGSYSTDDGSPPIQVTRDASSDPDQFARYFLQAAAGDPETAVNRVKEFLSPEARAAFKPTSKAVQVVRLVENPLYTPGDNYVTLTIQQVGQLQSNGLLDPTSDPKPEKLNINFDRVPGQTGLFVTKAPPVLLLSDVALSTFYQRHTIYFWNNQYTGLVPDVRYMPVSVPTVQQPTTILNWLTAGPADWLQDAVQPLPQGAAASGNIPAINNNRLVITLNAQTVPPDDPKALDRLRQQLQWSLRPLEPQTLELRIEHQDPVSFTRAAYQDSNAASRLADVPERFVIYNGVIRRLSESPRAVNAVPVLKPDANRGIQSAAMSTSGSHTFAAVVVGANGGQTLRVASAPVDSEADLRVVKGVSGSLGHPAWAITTPGSATGAVGLITANGRLYSFGPDGSPAQPVEWQGGDPGPIAAVSVAPDGYRVALVSRGKLYRAVLTAGGDGIALTTPEQILPPGLRSLSAVAWSSEGWLAVAGVLTENNRVSVMDTTIDGAIPYTRLSDIGKKPVTYLTAYPANPVTREEYSASESYVADGVAWDVLSEPLRITAADLAGPAGSQSAGTTPSAPFFLN
jgi:hypothetical protein